MPQYLIRKTVGSQSFLDFAAGGGRPREERTVAIAARLRQIGLGGDDGDRAVYLSADTVARHLHRFSDLDADDWLRVQRIVDEGEWNTGGPEKRLLWIEDNDKPWLVILKRTVRDEIYLQSYRRARSQEIRRIRGRQGEPGGPQPPPPNICRAG